MRKFLLCLAALLLLLTPAWAETYTFGNVRASVDIPSDYEVVLTPYNFSQHADWLAAQGLDADALLNSFEAEGIVLQAVDAENDRTLTITARRDTDAQTYFDLNKQDEDMRKEYRVSHTNGSVYSILGYTYSSAKWANYGGDVLRFLQTKYSLHQEGEQSTGYQRRTIRNGYSITLDMQVKNRTAKEADNAALEKVMKSFRFTEILPMPELPVKLAVSSAPPAETNEDTFVIKGTTAKRATVTATLFSLGPSGGQSFTTTAGGNGSFSLKIKLPSEGTYSLTLNSAAAGAIEAQRLYSVTFQKGILPVDVTQSPSATLDDVTAIAGNTIQGAKIQVAVSGPVNYNKTVTGKSFSFKIDTSVEGTYNIILSVTKKGLKDRTFTYTGTRTYSDGERTDKIRSMAKKITYANLAKNETMGKTAVLTGYITTSTQKINEWVVTLALTRNNSGTYKDIVYVICEEEPPFAVGTQVKLYGRASGSYSVLDDEGNVKNYPRLDAYFFDPVN